MNLPERRQVLYGRTVDRVYDPAVYGCAIIKPSPRRRMREAMSGFFWAAVTAAILTAIFKLL